MPESTEPPADKLGEVCLSCDGSGWDDGAEGVCFFCQGSGWLP